MGGTKSVSEVPNINRVCLSLSGDENLPNHRLFLAPCRHRRPGHYRGSTHSTSKYFIPYSSTGLVPFASAPRPPSPPAVYSCKGTAVDVPDTSGYDEVV